MTASEAFERRRDEFSDTCEEIHAHAGMETRSVSLLPNGKEADLGFLAQRDQRRPSRFPVASSRNRNSICVSRMPAHNAGHCR